MSPLRITGSIVSFAASLGLAALASWAAAPAARADTTPISGLSPNPDGGDPTDPVKVTACNGGPQSGLVYRNSETEPYIAVNPTNPLNMIAAWHQDRWSNGGGQSLGAAFSDDGGESWQQVIIPFTRCSGGQPRSAGDFERASDPWISFGPDGRAHYMALVFNDSVTANGMASAFSDDGGQSWSDPVIITASPARDPVGASLFHDKNSFTADPFDPNLVYSTWTLFLNGSFSLQFSRSIDGGKSWRHSRTINNFDPVDPATVAFFRQGTQIVVLPDGTLVNAFFRILTNFATGQGSLEQSIFRSTNQGLTWEQRDTVVSDLFPAGARDLELGVPVRDASQIPDIAVNGDTGELYMTWQDRRFNPDGRVGVVVARSGDGGDSWSAPVQVNRVADPAVQAFLPSVSVAADGTVGVMFYDFRNDLAGDLVLSTDVHLARFDADLTFRDEVRITPESFDLRQSVITGGRGYFPGDYVGLDVDGNDFVAAFTVTNPLGLPVEFPQVIPGGLGVDDNNRQDIVFARVPAAP
jgi:hypothetical protein